MSDPTSPPAPRRTTAMAVAIAWVVVGLPAAWGVYQTALKSKALFQPPPPPATAVTAPAAR